MEQLRFIAAVSIISIIFILITLVLSKKYKRNKFIKYIPTLAAATLTLGFWAKASYFAEGMEGIAYIVLAMMTAVAFVLSLISALIMGLFKRI
ncbi:hypothetical protein [Petroclostridium sp. X23]|uniref:hypothetical protein n=1 Tax=Petroclostridium sp. X23 TaxID=3045146 RepID=UPI0024AE3EDF|nr:hypothetical protein [Petroclostridium sp. X23]WHH57895.1 hypothetical protein QKW49_19080 [Petroclostridium sp. X23]